MLQSSVPNTSHSSQFVSHDVQFVYEMLHVPHAAPLQPQDSAYTVFTDAAIASDPRMPTKAMRSRGAAESHADIAFSLLLEKPPVWRLRPSPIHRSRLRPFDLSHAGFIRRRSSAARNAMPA